jgi:hypothetical protein
MTFQNPVGWPEEILGVIENSLTVEYASLTKKGVPITFPLMPQIGEDGRTLDVATGLTYPVKAERARNNPKVCLLYSEPLGCGLESPPCVLVYGLATVRDVDLHANTDRYVRFATKRFAELGVPIPGFFLRTMTWYLARIFVKVTPMRILWWEDGVLSKEPKAWQAPDGMQAPDSDPPPGGKGSNSLNSPLTEWHSEAEYAVKSLGEPVLTVVDTDGFPVPFRTLHASAVKDGFHLELSPQSPAPAQGKASLCFHLHDEKFSWNENKTFVGEVSGDVDTAFFKVDRLLSGQSLKKGSQVSVMLNMFKLRRQLAPRLKPEARRRGQPVPKVNLP